MPAHTDFDYKRYLASREWSLLREAVRERSGNTCEHCFIAPQQAVHHLTYERIGHEKVEDLMAVCNPCHEYFSGKSDFNPAFVWDVSPAIDVASNPYHVAVPRRACAPAGSRAMFLPCEHGCVWCKEATIWWSLSVVGLALPAMQGERDPEGEWVKRPKYRGGVSL